MDQRSREWSSTIALVVIVVLSLLLTAVLVAAAAMAAAIVAPVAGAAYLAIRLWLARLLWRSGGRFELGGLVRMADQTRTRLLAGCEAAKGVGGLAISFSPLFFALRSGTQAVATLIGGVLLLFAAHLLRRWLLSDAGVVRAYVEDRSRRR